MPVVRIEHSVPNYEQWKQVFDSDPVGRKAAGVRRYQILRLQSDPYHVMIDLEFGTVEAAEAFLVKMRALWGGAAKAVMTNPSARIAELMESREL